MFQTTFKLVIFLFFITACQTSTSQDNKQEKTTSKQDWINPAGTTIATRILLPDGYQRLATESTSYAHYLQHFKLKADGAKVHYYDGGTKPNEVHVAVLDIDVGKRDLQQCADAVMRLRAEFLYAQKDYEAIHFNFTNGFNATYDKWRAGYRIRVKGNQVSWYKKTTASDAYNSFRRYMDWVFMYAGTLSLSKELRTIPFAELAIGDVLIQGGSPGHAVLVIDMAVHPVDGEKVYLLAQSYMPAQSIHILKNPKNTTASPWYQASDIGEIRTPEWSFQPEDLKRFYTE